MDRFITLPSSLLAELRDHSAKLPEDTIYLFPGKNGKIRHLHAFGEMLKRLAKRAGLNSNEFILHRFRKTFATRHHYGGTPLRTLQTQLGHKHLNTTAMYLQAADAQSEELQRWVDAICMLGGSKRPTSNALLV